MEIDSLIDSDRWIRATGDKAPLLPTKVTFLQQQTGNRIWLVRCQLVQGSRTRLRLGGKWHWDRTGNTSIPLHAREDIAFPSPHPWRIAKVPYLFCRIPIRCSQRCHYLESQLLCQEAWKCALNIWVQENDKAACLSNETYSVPPAGATRWWDLSVLHSQNIMTALGLSFILTINVCFLWLGEERDR